MARSIARELGSPDHGERRCAGLHRDRHDGGAHRRAEGRDQAQVPLGRHGSPEEIAQTVLWLTGPGAAYVTGAVIPVDGGLGMGH